MFSDRIELAGSVGVKRKKTMEQPVKIRGVFTRNRYDLAGRLLGIDEVENTITAAGIDLAMNLIIGGSSDHLGSATNLVLKSSGGTVQKTITACDAGYPLDSDDINVPTKSIDYQWRDESVDVYEAAQAEVHTDVGTVVFSANASTGWGTKPSTENWVYKWRLSISSTGIYMNDNGIDNLLRIMANTVVGHWDGTASKARLYDDFDTAIIPDPPPTLLQELPPSLGPLRDTGNNTLYWEFEFADGQGNGTWGTFGMALGHSTFADPMRFGPTGTTGTKGSGDVWTWQFTLQF